MRNNLQRSCEFNLKSVCTACSNKKSNFTFVYLRRLLQHHLLRFNHFDIVKFYFCSLSITGTPTNRNREKEHNELKKKSNQKKKKNKKYPEEA